MSEHLNGKRINRYVHLLDGTVAIELWSVRAVAEPQYALIDVADVHLVDRLLWFPLVRRKVTYARAFSRGLHPTREVLLHRLLLPETQEVDHVNGDGLDNRRGNIRPCVPVLNRANQPKTAGRTSIYKGVSRAKNRHERPWRAQIQQDGRNRSLGYYPTQEAAARAYDAKAIELWGEYACVNFPVPGQRSAVDGLIRAESTA